MPIWQAILQTKNMNHQIDVPENIEGCVYKLWYADKYIILKCKTLARSIFGIKTDLHYFFKGTPGGTKESDLYFDFYVHVQEVPFQKFKVEIILSSNNPLELLKCEQIELEKAYDDPNCMNKSFEVYIPKHTQVNGKKSWINRGYYLNFMQWMRKRANQNTIV